jgi:hypothetical protein
MFRRRTLMMLFRSPFSAWLGSRGICWLARDEQLAGWMRMCPLTLSDVAALGVTRVARGRQRHRNNRPNVAS